MSRLSPDDGPMQWMEGLPEKELYDIYADTIRSRFPAFGVRDFAEARIDMAQTLHPHDPSKPIDQVLVNIIVTAESHDRFTDDLERFVDKHGLRGWLDYGESLLFVTDHGQFTDVPVVAETVGRIGLGHRSTTVQVVSEMISDLKIDLGQGEFDVIGRLRNISAVVQTVPRVDGSPSEGLERYRERKNAAGLNILSAVRDTQGSITVDLPRRPAQHEVEERQHPVHPRTEPPYPRGLHLPQPQGRSRLHRLPDLRRGRGRRSGRHAIRVLPADAGRQPAGETPGRSSTCSRKGPTEWSATGTAHGVKVRSWNARDGRPADEDRDPPPQPRAGGPDRRVLADPGGGGLQWPSASRGAG